MDSSLIDLMFAMAPPPAMANKEAELNGFPALMPVAFLGIFYALLIRPQQKQQKEHEKLVSELKSGDRVVAAGMVGTIITVKMIL